MQYCNDGRRPDRASENQSREALSVPRGTAPAENSSTRFRVNRALIRAIRVEMIFPPRCTPDRPWRARGIVTTRIVSVRPSAETPFPSRILNQGCVEVLLVEIRPQHVQKNQFGIRRLPEQEIG
jgi:hypothetical protein